MELIEIKIKNEEPLILQYDIPLIGQLYKENDSFFISYRVKFKRGLSPTINLYNILKDVKPEDIEYLITDACWRGESPTTDAKNVTLTDFRSIYDNVYVENGFISNELILEVG